MILVLAVGCKTTEPAPAPTSAPASAPASRPASMPKPERPKQQYPAATFFETTTYRMASSAGFGFSPDGAKILVHHDKTGVFNVYALAVDGSDEAPLTASDDRAMIAVSYFPQDERVLVTADNNGDELNHVLVREVDGSTRDLTPGDKLKAAFVGWHDDGKTFWLMTNERDQKSFDVYAYRTKGYRRKRIYTNPGFQVAAISGDGRWLALTKPNTSADSDLYLADLRRPRRKPKHITPHDGDIAYAVYGFTPDSKQLIYATNEHGEYNQAWTYDLRSKKREVLLEADWDVVFMSYSPSGRYRVSGINADAQTKVTIVDTTTNQPLTLTGVPPGDLAQVRFARDEKTIAFAVTSDTSPFDIYVAPLDTGKATRLTRALNADIDESDLVSATVVRYPSFDGLEIPGILYKPQQASPEHKVPAMVLVHGGPGGQTRQGYSGLIQHMVNHGYAVLGANNRGSSGYGKTFFHLDDRKHGDVDLKDIVYAKDYLASLDWVDADRIGVIGGSYGGFMVAAALAFEPEVFAVGIDIFGVTNWVRTLKSIPPWWEAFKKALYDEMGDPATDEARHRKISPLFHAERIQRPLLVVQGANDPRVLQVESDELVAAVKKNGVPVEYVVFPDEGHGFRKRANRIKASEAYVSFLDKYLKGGGRSGVVGL